jgi:hypothetical protein
MLGKSLHVRAARDKAHSRSGLGEPAARRSLSAAAGRSSASRSQAAGRQQPSFLHRRQELPGEPVALIGRLGRLEFPALGEGLEQRGEGGGGVDAGRAGAGLEKRAPRRPWPLGNPAVFGPLSPLAVPLLLMPRSVFAV